MAISVSDSLKLGFIDFWERKTRSMITLIGVVLGTMSIIVILSIVKGMNEMTLRWMNETGGMKLISISRNWRYNNPLQLPDFFTINEINFIKENIPPVEAFNAYNTDWGISLSNVNNQTSAYLNGGMPDMQKIMDWKVEQGRFFTYYDYKVSNEVIVLGSTIKDELFGAQNPLGKYITVQNTRLMVIGVMTKRIMEGFLGNNNPLEWENRRAFIPLTTSINKLGKKDQISDISIKTYSEEQAHSLKPIIEDILLNLRRGQPIFEIESRVEEASKMKENSKMLTVIFFFISCISLFVGGIVIMNIMLATIQERTREIGIRLAVGAREIDILFQFLIQTVLITFIGGILGVTIAISLIDFVGKYLKMNTKLDLLMILIALGVSVIVGLFFGIYPATKASKMDPVIALRHD